MERTPAVKILATPMILSPSTTVTLTYLLTYFYVIQRPAAGDAMFNDLTVDWTTIIEGSDQPQKEAAAERWRSSRTSPFQLCPVACYFKVPRCPRRRTSTTAYFVRRRSCFSGEYLSSVALISSNQIAYNISSLCSHRQAGPVRTG